jgi:dipeptide/tripeptide permease
MSIGFLLMALAFTVASRPAWPFAMVFVLLVLSEQFVVPIVMSAIGRISSAEDRGSMMGILFLTVAIGEWLSGRLGFHFENPEEYRLFFVQLVFVSSALAAASFFLGRRALAPNPA